ncbi:MULTISPECIES: hypothetical protein [unclassified Bradyrhizobium]|uniref:hypothetical protein n=1 Tax=unclassified Bradyrhizobium TaxID=2631580 RepID=UPI002478D420|nr:MULTISPECIES: hypothetical protein [unclassified Bradyrhizobium]WGS19140.1 hypothetical protein MTX22_32450 [Bradyrhizobium sp. ISRA463]WGS25978.1 hypothetical protein MTX19_30000 [Bradyrhizobium sp. ISRA464]
MIPPGNIIADGNPAIQCEQTGRRDNRALEDAGTLRRVHGGAAPSYRLDLTAQLSVTKRPEIGHEGEVLAAEAILPLFEMRTNEAISEPVATIGRMLDERSGSLAVTIDTSKVRARGRTSCAIGRRRLDPCDGSPSLEFLAALTSRSCGRNDAARFEQMQPR